MMSKEKQRAKRVSNLINTSVDDCRISLHRETDSEMLCDLLIACNNRGSGTSRERVVRRRISALIKAGVKS